MTKNIKKKMQNKGYILFDLMYEINFVLGMQYYRSSREKMQFAFKSVSYLLKIINYKFINY
jgi:hypothetical protein